MINVFEYSDYRKFLRDAYLDMKRTKPSGFTHRRIGQKGGFDPGLFSKVIQGERNISPKLIPGFCRAFGLVGQEAHFFANLVVQGQAKSEEEKRRKEMELAILMPELFLNSGLSQSLAPNNTASLAPSHSA
jgi:uncharacterized protein (TIGR02147 family)